MIAAFLLPFAFRGVSAPYLWVYYKILSTIDEPMLFLTGPDYVLEPDCWGEKSRWEVEPDTCDFLGYQVPSMTIIKRHHYEFFHDAIFDRILETAGRNPIAAFRMLLTEPMQPLEDAISIALEKYSGIEAVITWCNCPSLSNVCDRLEIPVIHHELGPLRPPVYRPTAYFDFSGVSGNTEAESRYAKEKPSFGDDVTLEKLQTFFLKSAGNNDVSCSTNNYDIGVVLQVEDDSNLIAYGNDHNNQSLLACALNEKNAHNKSILVRRHPGSQFAINAGQFDIDDSANSVSFLARCRHIFTVNSSVGLEALLYGKQVDVFGESSYRFINDTVSPNEKLARLAYYLFAYLIPFDLIFNADYLRFRLKKPTDAEIVFCHLSAYEDSCVHYSDNIDEMVSRVLEAYWNKKTAFSGNAVCNLASSALSHMEKTVASTDAQLFWAEYVDDQVLPLDEGCSVRHQYPVSGEAITLSMVFPEDVRSLAGLRFDPACTPVAIILHRLLLLDAAGVELWRSHGEEETISGIHGVVLRSAANTSWLICYNDDPQLHLNLPEAVLRQLGPSCTLVVDMTPRPLLDALPDVLSQLTAQSVSSLPMPMSTHLPANLPGQMEELGNLLKTVIDRKNAAIAAQKAEMDAMQARQQLLYEQLVRAEAQLDLLKQMVLPEAGGRIERL